MTWLKDRIPFLGFVLIGQDVVIRKDQDRAIVPAFHKPAERARGDLEMADRKSDLERPGAFLRPGCGGSFRRSTDILNVDLTLRPLLYRFDLRAILQAAPLDPNG